MKQFNTYMTKDANFGVAPANKKPSNCPKKKSWLCFCIVQSNVIAFSCSCSSSDWSSNHSMHTSQTGPGSLKYMLISWQCIWHLSVTSSQALDTVITCLQTQSIRFPIILSLTVSSSLMNGWLLVNSESLLIFSHELTTKTPALIYWHILFSYSSAWNGT